MADRERIAHLLRRATFGPTATELDAAERAGLDATRAALAQQFATPLAALPKADEATELTAAWIDRMVATKQQLPEKLVFFWHGHWATSVQKVKNAELMRRQLETFRELGTDGAKLTRAMTRDAALLLWLDGQRNTRKAPNENLARELLELFVLGPGNYTEDDIKATARVLTGWTVNRETGAVALQAKRHDPGPQTVLGAKKQFTVDELADHLTSQSAHPRFIAQRLWFRFATGEPIPSDVEGRIAEAYGAKHDVTSALGAVFAERAFQETTGHLVKQPVEWLVGALRQLGIRPNALTPDQRRQALAGLAGLGQVPLKPPSVGGWPAGAEWLTTAAAEGRLRTATRLAALASTVAVQAVEAAPVTGRPEALARLLVVDSWSDRSRAALTEVAKDPRRLLAVGLVTPEYTVI